MALISGGFLTLHIGLYYMTHHGRVDILTNDDFFCHVAITAKQNKHSNTYTKKSTLTFKPTYFNFSLLKITWRECLPVENVYSKEKVGGFYVLYLFICLRKVWPSRNI